MFDWNEPGFLFLGQSSGWDGGYNAALEVLRESSAAWLEQGRAPLVLLGPKIGESGKRWILTKHFSHEPQIFGQTLLPWNDWVRNYARDGFSAQGKIFRELGPVRSREFLRRSLDALERAGKLPSIGGLWREEQFFRSILREILELREAGFDEFHEVLRAREILELNKSQNRVDPEELWYLLKLFDEQLTSENPAWCDRAATLRAASERTNAAPAGLLLLGFERLSQLEMLLLRNLARETKIILPVVGQADEAHPLVRDLIISFPGKWTCQNEGPATTKKLPVLAAHTPAEEALSAGVWLRGHKKIRLVLSRENAQPLVLRRLFTGLGISGAAEAADFLQEQSPALVVLHNALALPDEGFSLAAISDYAAFLARLRQDQTLLAIGPKLAKLGFRRGLKSLFQLQAKVPECAHLLEELTKLEKALPRQGSGREFLESLELWIKNGAWFEWPRLASSEYQLDLHAAFAALLKGGAQLATELHERWTRAEWLRELKVLTETCYKQNKFLNFETIDWYRYGEWLAPAQVDTLTLVLGLSHSANPRATNNFYLDDMARARLADWRLECQRIVDQEALSYCQQLTAEKSSVVLSFAKHSLGGSGQGPSWLVDLFGGTTLHWPEAPWPYVLKPVSPEENFIVPKKTWESISVTMLNAWQECPFRSWGEHVERLSDGWLESDLDLPPMDRGALFHRAVELYFTKHQGRFCTEPKEVETKARLALADALQDRDFQYFKGGENLLQVHTEELARAIVNLLQKQAVYYSETPDLAAPICEQTFALQIPGTATVVKGKIDRIDRSQDGQNVIVVDYKTGASAPSSKDVLANENLQLQIYLQYASKSLCAEAVGGYFLQLKEPSKRQGILRESFRFVKGRDGPVYYNIRGNNSSLVDDSLFATTLDAALVEAKRRIESISAGEFTPSPVDESNCERCSLRPACRIHAKHETRVQISSDNLEKFAALTDLLKQSVSEVGSAKQTEPTPEQEAAISARGQLVFIEASAGTGKTSVLVERIAREIRELAARPAIASAEKALEHILAISFTEKSTQELQERIAKKLLPEYGALVAAQATHRASTIHGFCGKVIRDFPLVAGVSPFVRTITSLEARELLEEVLEDFFIQPSLAEQELLQTLYRRYSRKHLHGMLLDLAGKRALLENDKSLKNLVADQSAVLSLAEAFFARYDAQKSARAVLDFNDLERLALKVLESRGSYYRKQFTLVLVDEFQDTNSLQRRIVEAIAAPKLANLFVVGDAKQSIYRFRDADVAIFQSLRAQAAEQNALYSLSRNFRSQANIVYFVNKFCSHVMPKDSDVYEKFEASFAPALAQRQAQELANIFWHDGENKESEAELLAQQLRKLVDAGRSPGEIAILFRKLSNNEAYADAIKRVGLSYVQEGGEDFFGESIVLDGISLARALCSPWNRLAFIATLRSPWVGFSATEIQAVLHRAKHENISPWDACLDDTRLHKLGAWRESLLYNGLSYTLSIAYDDYPAMLDVRKRIQIDKLIAWIGDLEKTGLFGHALVNQISRWAGYESQNESIKEKRVPEPSGGSSIRLSTIHAAKGLEYPVCFLVDLDAKSKSESAPMRYYPGLGFAFKDPESEEKEPPAFTTIIEQHKAREKAESKRLLYVALTRARDELYLLCRKKESKLENWGDFLRKYAAQLPAKVVEIAPERLVEKLNAPDVFKNNLLPAGNWLPLPYPAHSTVSELAAYEFCPEFHRLKFVQSWEDSVLEYFPRDPNVLQKLRKPANEERLLLRELGLEKKERGIALHRVLERVFWGSGPPEWEAWLREIYISQGVDPASKKLSQLLVADIELLTNFLASTPGKELFAKDARAYSELPFVLQQEKLPVVGSVDRIVALNPSHWIVADYKSSLGEGNEARYTLQVWTYMYALQRSLAARGLKPKIEGLLVDLYTLQWLKIPLDVWTEDELNLLLTKIQYSHKSIEKIPVTGTKNCFHCPYVAHCDVGRKTVLSF